MVRALALLAPHFVALALLGSCDTTIDWVVDGEADYGQVFICDHPCTLPNGYGYEWCWGGDADELSALKHDNCRAIKASDRVYPWLVGCAWDCQGKLTGAGANAVCGEYCP